MRFGLLLFCALALPAWGHTQNPLGMELPAADVDRLALTAGNGETELKASADDKIHLHLELKQQQHSLFWLFHWFSESGARDLQGAVLQTRRDGRSLAVSVAYPDGDQPSDIKERWIISLPARIAVSAEMNAGELLVRDLSGGVQAKLEAGDLEIEAAQGPLTATVHYGRLHVITASEQPGAISVSASHGLAAVDWDGKYFGPPEKHGFWDHIHLGGNSVEQHGKGADDVKLHVQYGEADLRIGAVGEVKDYRDLFQSP
jgi:hypothetical protein